MRVAVLCDFAEEKWPSMDLVGDMLIANLNAQRAPGTIATRVQPAWMSRFSCLLPSPFGQNADRLTNRFWDYPRSLRRVHGFNLFHIVDHSYAHLVHSLDPSRTVVTCHDLDTFRCVLEPEKEPRPYWFRLMTTRILRGLEKAAHIVCVSETTRQQLIGHGIATTERTSVAYNGVDACFREAPLPFGERYVDRLIGPASEFIDLLHVGSTIPRKRIDVLLRVFSQCLQHGESFRRKLRLVHVGAPFTDEQLELARSLGIEDRVSCVPHVARALLPVFYRRAAVLLVPSEAEGFGLPVAEAMACGTALVASDIPSLREVAGDLATFCPIANLQVWTERVLSLLREREEQTAEFQRRSLQMRERAKTFSWQRNAQAVLDVYEQVLSQTNGKTWQRRRSSPAEQGSSGVTQRVTTYRGENMSSL